MAKIRDRVRPRSDALDPPLREAVLAKGRDIQTLQDLIGVMAEVIQEAEQAQK